jgi:hypothetical protein
LPFQNSTLAARNVCTNQSQTIQPKPDRQSKFGVILSRSVSPTPEFPEFPVRDLSPHKPARSNSKRSIYNIPQAAYSEPTISTNSLSSINASIKVYKPSPLAPTRPTLNGKDSSSGNSSLADMGASTAMSSRTSSATSLPILPPPPPVEPVSRRRPVHLKTTLRKEARQEKEKGHVHSGPISITEIERKRYEGVWASNCRQQYSGNGDFIENLVVRELWSRSMLPTELLGHIWYFPIIEVLTVLGNGLIMVGRGN